MKSFSAGWLALVLVGGLTACTDPIPAQQDALKTYPQVHLTNHYLQAWTRVQQVDLKYLGAQQLRVAVVIRNLTNDDLPIDYRYRFLNESGMEVEQVSSWQAMVLPKRGYREITITSMTALAKDFDLQIRQAE
jgi:uncharacterized protein YcfL